MQSAWIPQELVKAVNVDELHFLQKICDKNWEGRTERRKETESVNK